MHDPRPAVLAALLGGGCLTTGAAAQTQQQQRAARLDVTAWWTAAFPTAVLALTMLALRALAAGRAGR